MAWRVAGTYLESCNCDAICPCRRIGGVPGGRSTHGICLGALSWRIEDGWASGDRAIHCLLADAAGGKLTGSAQGSEH